MTEEEALKIIKSFDDRTDYSSKNVPAYIEALSFLIQETKDPKYMMELGGYYYEKREFDLALKYYEMAAECDYDKAYEGLAYIWYYGRTGTKDYKLAFEYFHKLMDKGNLVAMYKIADMYRNGYYVEKSSEMYEKLVTKAYQKAKNLKDPFDPVPEIYTRYAHILSDAGKVEEACEKYQYAKAFLGERIKYSTFFGNLTIMKLLIEDMYKIMEFDEIFFDFFDLYHVLKSPCKVSFGYVNKEYVVESFMDGEECRIRLGSKVYESIDDFFMNASIGGVKLIAIHDRLYGFEII